MRALGIFTVVLISGIWGPAITRALSPSTDELIRKIQELESIPDLATSYEGRSKLAEVDRMVGEKCRENGGSNAYDNLAKGLRDFMSCLQSELDMQQLEAEIGNAKSNGNWKPVFNEICPKLPAMMKCGDPLTESIKSCLEPEERNAVDTTQRIMGLLLELSCHDGGDQAASFVATGGVECLSSKQKSLQVCGTEVLSRNLRPGRPFEALIPKSLSSLDLDEKECEDVDKFRTCSVAVFRGCENPESANAVDAMFTSFKKLASCNRVTRPTPLSASLDTWINSTSIGEQVSSVTELDNFKSFLRGKCEKNAGPAAYDTALENMQFVWNSTQLLINPPQFQAEISTVHSMEDLHNVFRKYCRRAPILNELDKYYFDSMKPCLELKERRSVDVVHNVSSATLDFLCYNGGDRIATFIAEGAMKCLVAEGAAILSCATQNLGSYIQAFGSPINGSNDALPVLGSEFCTDLRKFKDCSVEVLAECEDQSSANLVSSLLTSISSSIPCGNWPVADALAVTEISSTTFAPELDERLEIPSKSHSDIDIITRWPGIDILDFTNEDIQIYLREKCERNGGPTAYETARKIPEYLSDWHKSVMEEMKQLAIDIREAQLFRPDRKLNIVFRKYCRKVPTIKRRMRYVAESIKPCLDSLDQSKVDIQLTATSLILELACQNKANNIAKFVATGGGECLRHHKREIDSCFEQNQFSKSRHLAISNPTIDLCTYYLTEIRRCIVNEMKKCADPTPAAIVDSMLNRANEGICNRLVA